MPKKPRRGKAFQLKKKKVRQPAVSSTAASTVTARKDMRTVATPTSGAATKTKSPAGKYPYVTAELRRIGILAGAIVVVLIILALVL